MKKTEDGQILYSPSDLIKFFKSPFSSWMDRYYLENPGAITPDEQTEDEKLIADSGDQHESEYLKKLKADGVKVVEIDSKDPAEARQLTLEALEAKDGVVFQAALAHGEFAGLADFLELDERGEYQVWDTKLARSPKPYFAVQLCCYSELLAAMTGNPIPAKFGVVLGTGEKVEFKTSDFFHYYQNLKAAFLAMQQDFTGDFAGRPEPEPRADHGRWTSHAEAFFADTDHLVQVAGITAGQIKKLKDAGIETVARLAESSDIEVPKLAAETLEKLVAQARLQKETGALREEDPDSAPAFEVLPHVGPNGEDVGLAALPPADEADVFFDMEGYPLVPGGLEYLFGLCTRETLSGDGSGKLRFMDWWAHDRESEKAAFEGFVDFVYGRWKESPGMHIYHYAPYEKTAVRRLSTFHDTRQDEVDELLRNDVFVDLYQVVRQGLRVGEGSYSIKSVERLYRPKRSGAVSSAVGSIVEYANWMDSGEPRDWQSSPILQGIRDYNEDDCVSTAELDAWLRKTAVEKGIASGRAEDIQAEASVNEPPEEDLQRQEVVKQLREAGDPRSLVLADLLEFHRREDKPVWWRMFDRADAEASELRDDHGCIEGVTKAGEPVPVKQSLQQEYRFDPAQECKLREGRRVMFTHDTKCSLELEELDTETGRLKVKVSRKKLQEHFDGEFPAAGSLIEQEHVPSEAMKAALLEIGMRQLEGSVHPSVASLKDRTNPADDMAMTGEEPLEAALRITSSMEGGCLVVQGPPGTGKTYTAARVVGSLLEQGKKVGIASNSHKAILNLVAECGEAINGELTGIKVGGDEEDPVFEANPGLRYVASGSKARDSYAGGLVGGTAWLFSRPEWEGELDFLFIDEAGQVSLANAVAMARSARNLVLLGDQMQLEQPIQGSHPGEAGQSVLQYALKDLEASQPDAPVYHAVVPPERGLFLGVSRRMHPDVCKFISESVYEGRLAAHATCAHQRIVLSADAGRLVWSGTGIQFLGVEHDGNIQRSDEEVAQVRQVYEELAGSSYTDKSGETRPLALEDFLFVTPYNAQVRALQQALPAGAKVGSVDRFQGQEEAVCILSLCSSFGEYGSRGLGFILDLNRVNVAISRAKCLAVVVADPRIAMTPVGSMDEMKLVNLFCRIKERSNRRRAKLDQMTDEAVASGVDAIAVDLTRRED